MTTIVQSIFAIFTAIGEWMVDAVASMVPIFYVAETGLTLLGTLALIGLGISITFLLISVVTRFLRFK